MARPRTQASLAVSDDAKRWVVLNASPDLPYQLASAPALQPRVSDARRHSPLTAVIISSGDIDCIAGLLSLREQQGISVYAPGFVQGILEDNSVFRVLDRDLVKFVPLPVGAPEAVQSAGGDRIGLWVEAFRVGGKVPLYQETSDDIGRLASNDAVIGLSITDRSGRRLLYVPACSAVDDHLRRRIAEADLLFFDGTLWRDDEMITAGVGRKTGRRMGHISISGPEGAIAALSTTKIQRKVFIHINNTNPILCDDSPQAAFVRESGWDIAYDGMEVTL